MINLFQPSVGEEELAAIREVFSSNWLGVGDRVAQFESEFADYLGRPTSEVQAVSSCTEGLFQSVSALGLGPGDEIILPTISFVGAAHAVRSSGATVVLCDVDPATLNPTAEHVERAITSKTRGMLVLHYGGAPGSIGELSDLATRKDLLLIEDAACSLGSSQNGSACGTFGDVGVWSFDSMKVLTTTEGGMVWSKSELTSDRIRNAVRLGVASSGFGRRGSSSRWWEVDPLALGRRGTMNDVAAAMGSVQLARLPAFLRRRSEIAASYDVAIADLEWIDLPTVQAGQRAPVFYWIHVASGVRDRLASYLLEREIYTSFRYWPLHKTSMYRSKGAFPGGDSAAESTLLLPLHQGLSDQDVERVLDSLSGFRP